MEGELAALQADCDIQCCTYNSLASYSISIRYPSPPFPLFLLPLPPTLYLRWLTLHPTVRTSLHWSGVQRLLPLLSVPPPSLPSLPTTSAPLPVRLAVPALSLSGITLLLLHRRSHHFGVRCWRRVAATPACTHSGRIVIFIYMCVCVCVCVCVCARARARVCVLCVCGMGVYVGVCVCVWREGTEMDTQYMKSKML